MGCPQRASIPKCCTKSTSLVFMIILNFGMLLAELTCGFLTNSMSIIADSFHMISDILALVIALISLKVSQRKTSKHTFGWVRAEVLGALVNGVFLLALCLSLLLEAIHRIYKPEKMEDPWILFMTGMAGLIVNGIGLIIFHGHSKEAAHTDTACDEDNAVVCHTYQARVFNAIQDEASNKEDEANIDGGGSYISEHPFSAGSDSKKHKSSSNLNMKGVFLHVLSDTLGSCIVVLSSVLCWIFKDVIFLQFYIDPILSLIMITIISISTFPLVIETAMILLQTTPKYIDIEVLKTQLLQIKGVTSVHDFHCWRLVGECIIATVHIHFKSLADYILATDLITKFFHQNGIHSVTIQPEFDEGNDEKALECLTACEIPQCIPSRGDLSKIQCCDDQNVVFLSQRDSESISTLSSDL